jgi:hypothetical protein
LSGKVQNSVVKSVISVGWTAGAFPIHQSKKLLMCVQKKWLKIDSETVLGEIFKPKNVYAKYLVIVRGLSNLRAKYSNLKTPS